MLASLHSKHVVIVSRERFTLCDVTLISYSSKHDLDRLSVVNADRDPRCEVCAIRLAVLRSFCESELQRSFVQWEDLKRMLRTLYE